MTNLTSALRSTRLLARLHPLLLALTLILSPLLALHRVHAATDTITSIDTLSASAALPLQVSAGWHHTCAVRNDGTLACWGNNDNGRANPPAGSFTQVSAGYHHTCAVRSDDTLACWGENNFGEASPPVGSFTQVSADAYYTCAIRSDGTLACWGNNQDGQANPPAGSFTQINAGEGHTCAIRSDGTLACWGANHYGQINPPAGSFTQVSAGWAHTCATKSDGTLACWGYNAYGQATPPAGSFTQISAGGDHTCAIKSDATLTCWGDNSFGQASPPAGNFTQVSEGRAHTCAIKSDGTLTCWGYNFYGQAPQLSLNLTSLPDGAVDFAYSQQLSLSATNYTPSAPGFVVSAGSLPAGLSLSASGLLAGTPTSGGTFSFTVTGTDANSFTASQSYTLLITSDSTPPVITPNVVGTLGNNGWYVSDVTVNFTCAEETGGSGLASNTVTGATLTTDGVNQSVTNAGTCSDNAGNVATPVTVSGFNLDKTPPTLAPVVSPTPVLLGAVATMTSGATDGVSGLASQSCGTLDTSSVGIKTVTCTATDNAGNTANVSVEYTVVPLTLLQQVQAVRANLAALVPSGSSNSDTVLQKAIGKIDQALAVNLWQADGNHLTLIGDDAFNRLQDAVKELAKIKNPPPAIGTASRTLATISRALAQIALDEAIAAPGDAKKIAKAQSKLSKGDSEAPKGKLDRAIAQYEDCWEYAQQAIGLPVASSLLAEEQSASSDATVEEEDSTMLAQNNFVFLPVINR